MALICTIALTSEGQIKISTDGKVNLGTTSEICPPYTKVYADGNMLFGGGIYFNNANAFITASSGFRILGEYTDLIFADVYDDPSIYPALNHHCFLGKWDRQFYKIYSYQIFANQVAVTSDKRLKENIREIESPLSKILQTQGKKYDFKNEGLDSIKDEKQRNKMMEKNKNRLGFLAQDLQLIIPEAVVYEEDDDKYYIDYNSVIPVMVEAMKEQQVQIEDLKAEITKLKGNSKEKSATITEGKSETDIASLAQNIPNPFSRTTKININLPSSVSNAILYVYNMQGAQIKSIPVNERGNTNVIIEGNTLDAGMYLYTLVADGKEVDTKKMILTK